MKKKVKKVMLGMLMMSMLVSGMVMSQTNPAAAASDDEITSVVVSSCNRFSAPLSEIQYQKFMSYLTQEYAPELKTEWEKAFAERQSIEPDIQIEGVVVSGEGITATNAAGEINFTPVSAEDLEKMKANLPEGTVIEAWEGRSSVDSEAVTIVKVAKNGTVNANTAVEQKAAQTEDSVCVTITGTAEGTSENEKYTTLLNLQDELDQALTNNDSALINNVLGKMLANYKEMTEDIKTGLSNVVVTEK